MVILQIALLQKESEISLEELLARYRKVGSKIVSSFCWTVAFLVFIYFFIIRIYVGFQW